MKTPQPSTLALRLLNRFIPDGEPLAGDLLEEFGRKQSQLWLWRQVLLAILIHAFRRPADLRPLKLVDHEFDVPERRWRRRHVNLTGSPLPGIGGVGLAALAILVTVVSPEGWLIVLSGIVAGIVLGAVLVMLRRYKVPSHPPSLH
jgi:hypothetical protein